MYICTRKLEIHVLLPLFLVFFKKPAVLKEKTKGFKEKSGGIRI